MLRTVFGHMRQNVVAYIALFVALGGTSAYAANTISTSDIIDNQVTSADVRDDNLGFGGLASQDLGPGSVGTSEVANFSLGNGDFLTGSVDSRVVTDNSLTGTDINESTLNMPPTTTTTFAGTSSSVGITDAFTKVVGKNLSPGSYAVVATATIRSGIAFGADITRDSVCELRNGSGFIGGTQDRRTIPDGQQATSSLSMNGGAQVPSGGGEVSLWCRYQSAAQVNAAQTDAQMMITRIDGFF